MQRIILIGLATLLTACANQPSNNTSQKVASTQTEAVSHSMIIDLLPHRRNTFSRGYLNS